MTENEVYEQALNKVFEHLESGDTGFDIQIASYLFGVMDVMRIIKEGQENDNGTGI